jgi:hypothetical protein
VADELKHAEHAIAAAGEALVQDVITTVRAHPQYADIVNRLTDQAIQALLASL